MDEWLRRAALHEHWRVASRRAYFTGGGALDRTLQRFRRFYNFERPHHGYRVRGRTPVFGVHAVAR